MQYNNPTGYSFGQNWGQPIQSNGLTDFSGGDQMAIPNITPIMDSNGFTSFNQPVNLDVAPQINFAGMNAGGSVGQTPMALDFFNNNANQAVQGQINSPQNTMLGNLQKGWGDLSMNQKFNTGIGAAQSLFGIYSGFKQLGMAKKQMQQQTNQWNQTWDATKKGLNEASELRSKLRNNGEQSGIDRDAKKYQV